jgi:hypothetical protein
VCYSLINIRKLFIEDCISFKGGENMFTLGTYQIPQRKNCVFCDNWLGDADFSHINISTIQFNQNATGGCTAKMTMNPTALNTCNRFTLSPKYAKYK